MPSESMYLGSSHHGVPVNARLLSPFPIAPTRSLLRSPQEDQSFERDCRAEAHWIHRGMAGISISFV